MKNVRLELEDYLEDDALPRTSGFDVLNWWKANEPKYSTLQAIARDILAIPVSTVASESALVLVEGNSTLESVGYATIYDDDEIDSDESCATLC
ncbi:hypothetical protein ACSBR1_037814 [Camellia fascicularis]